MISKRSYPWRKLAANPLHRSFTCETESSK
jgi:hypothetical protein